MAENTWDSLTIELSDPKLLQTYLVASLTESGSAFPDWHAQFQRACGWYATLLGQGFDRLPFFLVYDLGYLLLEGRRFPFRVLAEENAEDAPTSSPERARHIAYENRLLNRFLSVPTFAPLAEAIEEGANPDARIAATLECWVAPLRRTTLPSIQTAANTVRNLGVPGKTTPADCRGEIEVELDLTGLLAHQAEAIVKLYDTVPIHQLVGPEDLFVIRHFEALESRAQRLVARQIKELEQQLGKCKPPPSHWQREAPQAAVDLDDSGYFPQGGLDELANRGSIENLLRTELAYIDDDEEIDIFTVRYVEGELLYYTRDEGQLMRRRRTVHISLELHPSHHILFPGHPARLSTAMHALVDRLVDDLFEVLLSDALIIELHLSGEGSRDIAQLWRVRFSEGIQRGEIVIHERKRPLTLDNAKNELMQTGRITSVVRLTQAEHIEEGLRLRLNRDGLKIFTLGFDPTYEAPEETNETDDNGDGSASDLNELFHADGFERFDLNLGGPRFFEELSLLRTALVWRILGV